ncbi:hypothetical protein [Gordonia sp. (in: high G+C Gram-positive bacteria)]|uniref:hypothetical protein n=1 Tax=Gordonia sp. (in: high G+C Gram-positive bacteria) TaxID=84139 RepID=UPI003C76931D
MGEKTSVLNQSALAVAQHLADHDGVITKAQAAALGMSRNRIQGRLDSGLWTAEASGVYLSAEHQLSPAARVRIAVAAHTGVLDRTAAAWWHGLIPELPSPITVSIPRTARKQVVCSVEVEMKSRTFPAEDVAVVRGISVTGLPLTVLAASAELEEGISMMDRALQIHLVGLTELRASLSRNSGAHGMRQARRLLAAAEDVSESAAERLFAKLLREYGITGWTQQFPFCGMRLDFAWVSERIAIEIHGWKFHRDNRQWQRDQHKTNVIGGAGWLPLIYTWEMMTRHTHATMREVADAVNARRQ